MLKILRKMYLSVHALNWMEITPDDPRRQTKVWEQWPGRCELAHNLEFHFRRKYLQLIRDAKEDEGIFFLPSGMKGDIELMELARKHFGPRCVVCNYNLQLDADFAKEVEKDYQQAIKNRGPSLTESELAAWKRSKAWAIDLNKQLGAQGYTYDPATVEFVAFGEDWCGCAGTYPIHMGRALGLAKPIERRFDLINPDCSPMLLKATAVEQNLPLPENIRLFTFKTAKEHPTWGRYVAQYWEGIHGIMDSPHIVEVNFPPGSVREVNVFGVSTQNDAHNYPKSFGHVVMGVGCGMHTLHDATLIMAEESLSLNDFRAALLAGKVSKKR